MTETNSIITGDAAVIENGELMVANLDANAKLKVYQL